MSGNALRLSKKDNFAKYPSSGANMDKFNKCNKVFKVSSVIFSVIFPRYCRKQICAIIEKKNKEQLRLMLALTWCGVGWSQLLDYCVLCADHVLLSS